MHQSHMQTTLHQHGIHSEEVTRWPVTAVSNFPQFYFRAVNLWTVVATLVPLAFLRWLKIWLHFSLQPSGPENGPQHKSTEKEEGSSVRWDEKICPLVQQLETAAAGTVASAITEAKDVGQAFVTNVVWHGHVKVSKKVSWHLLQVFGGCGLCTTQVMSTWWP